jgi:spoIIIJ-associated protein
VETRNESTEFSARTVEEATAQGLATLGLTADEAEIVVVSRGSRGILGLGAENARVRVMQKSAAAVPTMAPPVAAASAAPVAPVAAPAAKEGVPSGPAQETAQQILSEILRLMSINARVVVRQAPIGSEDDAFVLDVNGQDLGVLIGRRGETLAALQYLVRQIVGHKTGHWSPIIVDVEQYKERRTQSLQSLAMRMAERVTGSGQAVTLEAMPPAERRIVHLALRDHASVMTRSIGEGENRKVMILPKD